MDLFNRIKELAEEQHISLKELGIKLNLGENAIYQWKKRTPGIDKIEKIADYFNVSTDYLLGRTNDKHSHIFPLNSELLDELEANSNAHKILVQLNSLDKDTLDKLEQLIKIIENK
ncbi:HTH domain-containing protein [Listeria floridensis FSL S10-1187]|uniref:HTH domain-containing protein n=1 Tax=Listeria floridensis FSL S10-1187 TaxID=1265817 RepID=A0ABP3AZQ2_9LIST|nr:helix-turn-helix transcriptional regulator [Listeria floridensis]EUJ33123.1 HTH domain-containing protein [Listeria floridensis FSL S10-1187]